MNAFGKIGRGNSKNDMETIHIFELENFCLLVFKIPDVD